MRHSCGVAALVACCQLRPRRRQQQQQQQEEEEAQEEAQAEAQVEAQPARAARGSSFFNKQSVETAGHTRFRTNDSRMRSFKKRAR